MTIRGYHKIAIAVPKLTLADPAANAEEICKQISSVQNTGVSVMLFPELCVTGYSCGDLFQSRALIEAGYAALGKIAEMTKWVDGLQSVPTVIVGAPIIAYGKLYNCAIVISDGKVSGIVPKSYLPNYKEFYEKRWFASGKGVKNDSLSGINDSQISFGTDLIFNCRNDDPFPFAVEVCEDLWAVNPPSNDYALAGAEAIFNLSASNELVGKASFRKDLVVAHSAKLMSAYFYASSGIYESVSDVVFGGHMMAAVNGHLIKENDRFNRESEVMTVAVDFEAIEQQRRSESIFRDYDTIEMRGQDVNLYRTANADYSDLVIDPHPFVPSNESVMNERCQEIFTIQSTALANRLQHVGENTKAVIGVSGGLDSTLALLVVEKAFKLLDKDLEDIIAVTMPGPGTSDRTFKNANELCFEMGMGLKEIRIKEACEQHLKDIGHESTSDVTYENVQARERTQVLMDLANKHDGIVIGTGDLSEIALGWCTYNGDHISMYAVNCSVPKTLVKHLVSWVADSGNVTTRTGEILHDIVDTPISPELLAPKDGEISQKTEDIIGPYELHDFFLYYTIKFGFTPDKIITLAKLAFTEYEEAEIKTCMETFIKRFFGNQFKRNCIPDGPKVGSISLSPRGDWRMPVEASSAAWMKS